MSTVKLSQMVDGTSIVVDPITGKASAAAGLGPPSDPIASIAGLRTLGFGAAQAAQGSAVLPLSGGTMNEGAVTKFVGDHATGAFLQHDAPASRGATPSFLMRADGALFNSTWDPTVAIGFNLGETGPLNPAYGASALRFEHNYEVTPGNFLDEVHLIFTRKNGSESIRLFSGSSDPNTGMLGWRQDADNWTLYDAHDHTLILFAARGADDASPLEAEFGVNLKMRAKPDTNSAALIFETGGATNASFQASAAVSAMGLNVNAGALWLYGSAGGAASILARSGMTMGRDGDRAVGTVALTIAGVTGQTAHMLDATTAGGSAGDIFYVALNGDTFAKGKFACNNATPQAAAASGGALAAYAAGANGLDTGAHMSSLHALVVAIRAALVANGIMS